MPSKQKLYLTGQGPIDLLTGGIRSGEMVLVMAPSGQGKTTLMATLILNLATNNPTMRLHALLAESPDGTAIEKMACGVAGVTPMRYMNARAACQSADAPPRELVATPEEVARVEATIAKVQKRLGNRVTFSLDFRPTLRQALTALASPDNDGVIIDHIGLLDLGEDDKSFSDRERALNGLVAAALENNKVLIVTSQVQRGTGFKAGTDITLDNAKGSMAVPNASVTTLVVQRYTNKQVKNAEGQLVPIKDYSTLRSLKSRNGNAVQDNRIILTHKTGMFKAEGIDDIEVLARYKNLNGEHAAIYRALQSQPAADEVF